jgi:hypothetical protein
MLAFTTYVDPRNLLIDLAFFGLSTITREWPLESGSTLPPDFFVVFFPAPEAFGFEDLGAVRFRDSGFSALPLSLGVDPGDFLATMSSYLSSSVLTAWVDPSRPSPTREGR